MGFFGLGKKKSSKTKDASNAQAAKARNNAANATKGSANTVPPNLRGLKVSVNTPLSTIEEGAEPNTPPTEKETPLLSSLNVVSGDYEEHEIVYGDNAAVRKLDFGESPLLGLDFSENSSQAAYVDPVDLDMSLDEEEPFDHVAVFRGREDPTILDIEKAQSNDDDDDDDLMLVEEHNDEAYNIVLQENCEVQEQIQEMSLLVDDDDDDNEPPPPPPSNPPPPLPERVARQLLDTFNCQTSTSTVDDRTADPILGSFYDGMCGSKLHKRSTKRPYFSKEFTMAFLKEATQSGIPLLYHCANTTAKGDGWTGKSVMMRIRLGNSHGVTLVQPQLQWTSMGGGHAQVVTEGVDLLDIQNVLDSADGDDIRDDGGLEDMCFFSVTSTTGDVFLFETSSYEERDRVVNGIKNLIARLSFHLVAGNEGVSAELYSEDCGQMSGDLPSLRTLSQSMNIISHAFLDSGPVAYKKA